MDVPFVSSGAISRTHYALVRKVETAQTPQLADHCILAEVDSIRSQLSRSTLTLRQCRELLILLLYCAATVVSDGIVDLSFALHHAVNLAESSQTVQDKRIGYLFCAEAMPADHELQLMLVNTLRKDLESSELPRICLALDTLIQFSTADVIPAIQARLTDLLSYTSHHVRKRALVAFHKLSRHDTGILKDLVGKVEKRMTDADWVVGGAALTVWVDLLKAGYIASDRYQTALSALVASAWRARPEPIKNTLLLKILDCLDLLTLSRDDVRIVLKIIQACSAHGPASRPALQACYRALSHAPVSLLLPSRSALVDSIRPLIASSAPAPNDVYTFISCLGALDPALWAGTSAEVPAVLEGWEVERVVGMLQSDDHSIRIKVMRLLCRVDPTILEAYYTRLLLSEPVQSSADFSDTARRLLELAEVLSGENGEAYAGHVTHICDALEGALSGMPLPLEKRQVLQEIVEGAVVKMRDASGDFRNGCIGALFARVPDTEAEIGPTMMVILTALVVEYLQLSAVSPSGLLRGFGRRLGSYGVSIQDACLLCMMRLVAEVENVPQEVQDAVRASRERSRAYIRRRCDQLLEFSVRKVVLREILSIAKSPSLPDFVVALEAYTPSTPQSPPLNVTHSPERPSSRASTQGGNKLRYDAYDPPKPAQRRSVRRLSSGSDVSAQSRLVGQREQPQDPLTRTLSPGDLALAAGDELETLSVGSPRHTPSLPIVNVMDDESTMKADLIALDSPFISEPIASISDVLGNMRDLNIAADRDFQNDWDSMSASNTRGWCEASADAVVRRLRKAGHRWQITVIPQDHEPFAGEVKISITADRTGCAVVRLKVSDDNTTLWHMRSGDTNLRTTIKGLLSDL